MDKATKLFNKIKYDQDDVEDMLYQIKYNLSELSKKRYHPTKDKFNNCIWNIGEYNLYLNDKIYLDKDMYPEDPFKQSSIDATLYFSKIKQDHDKNDLRIKLEIYFETPLDYGIGGTVIIYKKNGKNNLEHYISKKKLLMRINSILRNVINEYFTKSSEKK